MDVKKMIFRAPAYPFQADLGIGLLRISAGLIMLMAHGWPKYENFIMFSVAFPDPLGLGSQLSLMLAIFAELFCSLALIAGFATRLALVPLSFTMFIAFFVIHAADPFVNKELALVYLMVFLILFITGPGRFSIDKYLYRKISRPSDPEPKPQKQQDGNQSE